MNVIFITMSDIQNIDQSGIYTDLLREFLKNKHRIFVVSPTERKHKKNTYIIKSRNCRILKVRTGNLQKTNIIEKGISTILLERQYIHAIEKYYGNIKFDLILYSTPPITIVGAVRYIKHRDNAKTYLLLKDIFPQNAVDLGMIEKNGLKGWIYKLFRNKEKNLYKISDYIGCMSQANVDFLLRHNREVKPEHVEICPNSIEVSEICLSDEEKMSIRNNYDLPSDKVIYIYGGNLGQPQGIPFLIKCLKSMSDNKNVYFLIVGSGTEYDKIAQYITTDRPVNVKLMRYIPESEYEQLVASCDVGMIFLDHRFTIPNFPSRILSYMQACLPVLAVTDPNTDMGMLIEKGGYGWWCESNNIITFKEKVMEAYKADRKEMGNKALICLKDEYTVEKAYFTIMKHFDE